MSICTCLHMNLWEEHGHPLQYSCLENPTDRGAWWATVHGVTKGRTWLKQLSIHTCIYEHFVYIFFYWIVNFFKTNCRWSSVQSVQSLSCVWLFVTPWITARQASLSITNSQSLPKPMSIESVMPSSHLILCHPLLLLPSIPSSIRIFSNESALRIRWLKYWSFSFSISPSNEHPGLISWMDWLDLLEVQGALKSLLQHHSSKASILQHSSFFTVQLSHPYMTTGKTICLD